MLSFAIYYLLAKGIIISVRSKVFIFLITINSRAVKTSIVISIEAGLRDTSIFFPPSMYRVYLTSLVAEAWFFFFEAKAFKHAPYA